MALISAQASVACIFIKWFPPNETLPFFFLASETEEKYRGENIFLRKGTAFPLWPRNYSPCSVNIKEREGERFSTVKHYEGRLLVSVSLIPWIV
jgi:hypothetical protein